MAICALAVVVAAGCGGATETSGPDLFGELVTSPPSAPFETDDLPTGGDGYPLRAAAVEGDWSTYRGNAERTGTRLAPGIVRPRIAWSAEVGIQGYANTPLVDEQTVYVTSQGDSHNVADSDDGFYAIDRESGQRRWAYATNEDINGASLTDEFVIGGADDGTLYAVRRTDGTLAWQTELGDLLTHGPLVVGDRLYVHGQEHVTMLDARTGQGLARVPGSSAGWEPRGGLAARGETIFRTAEERRVDAIADGDRLWGIGLSDAEAESWGWSATFSPPMVVGGAVVVAAPSYVDYESASIRIGLIDADNGDVLWSIAAEEHIGAPMMTSDFAIAYDQHHFASLPWLMNGMLYHPQVSNPYLVAFSLASGRAVNAVELPDCRCRQFPSIVGVPSRGYFPRHDGALYAFTPATGTHAWAIQLGRHAEAGQAASMVGLSSDPYGYGGGYEEYCAGEPYDSTALFATPAIGNDGTLYVGTGDGWLYAIVDDDWE